MVDLNRGRKTCRIGFVVFKIIKRKTQIGCKMLQQRKEDRESEADNVQTTYDDLDNSQTRQTIEP